MLFSGTPYITILVSEYNRNDDIKRILYYKLPTFWDAARFINKFCILNFSSFRAPHISKCSPFNTIIDLPGFFETHLPKLDKCSNVLYARCVIFYQIFPVYEKVSVENFTLKFTL